MTLFKNSLRQPDSDDAYFEGADGAVLSRPDTKHSSVSAPNRPALVIAGMASLLIAVLAAGGPFFDPAQSTAAQSVVLQFMPGDGQVVTAVGKLDRNTHAFVTTRTAGALVYGPYMTLQPGRYAVSWTGAAGANVKPRFDVFSVTRGVITSGAAPVAPGATTLQRLTFELKEAQSQIEFRVFVEAGDEASVDGIALQVDPENEAGKHE